MEIIKNKEVSAQYYKDSHKNKAFEIAIYKAGENLEAWLMEEGFGISVLMIGTEGIGEQDFIKVVEENLEKYEDTYIALYENYPGVGSMRGYSYEGDKDNGTRLRKDEGT